MNRNTKNANAFHADLIKLCSKHKICSICAAYTTECGDTQTISEVHHISQVPFLNLSLDLIKLDLIAFISNEAEHHTPDISKDSLS
jgi:hypothetical protein